MTPDTVELGRELYELRRTHDERVERLAERYGISRSYAFHLVAIGRENSGPDRVVSSGRAASDSGAAARPESQPHTVHALKRGAAYPAPGPSPATDAPALKPPRRLTERALLHRAWIAAHVDLRLRSLPADTRLFWLETTMAIGTIGDGATLLFEERGFDGRAQFCTASGADDAQLTLLVRRRLLDELDGGIALPRDLGLTPKERIGGNAVPSFFGTGGSPPTSSRPGKTPDRRQGTLIMGLQGRQPDSGIIPSESYETGALDEAADGFESDGITVDSSFIPDTGLARVVDADVKEDSQSLNYNVDSNDIPCDAAGERGESQEIPLGESQETAAGSTTISRINTDSVAHLELGAELMRLAKIARSPNGGELGLLAMWLGAEPALAVDTAMTMIGATIKNRIKRCNPGSMPETLHYFDKEVLKALATAARPVATVPAPQTSPPPPIASALSAEDQALQQRLAPAHAAGWERRDTCPRGPSPEAWKEALAAGKGVLAERWLAIWTAWNAVGEPQDRKPPNFGMWKLQPGLFAKCLDDVEDMLTGPDPDSCTAAD